ncbi:MAG TPA: VOC family protein [Acidimicrobiales bacterium]|nr:VOC family protein [Acidimicrobiales bacterium]
MPVRSLGYIRWATPQAEAWRDFATGILGLMAVSGPDPDSLYFRHDDRPYRLMVTPGSAPQVSLGFEVTDDIELEVMGTALEYAGVKVVTGSEEEAASRRVTGLLKMEDPAGVPVELYHGPILDHVRLQTPLVSGFVTGAQGMGHVVLGIEELEQSVDFYRRALGFFRRNTMRMDLGTTQMGIHFLGCNQRHHTLGLVNMPMPGNLVHLMIEAVDLDDVGLAYDRCHEAKVPIAMTLGRHTNDHMVSFYCLSPDGVMVELGWGGLAVEEPDTTYEITKGSLWGHKPPRR